MEKNTTFPGVIKSWPCSLWASAAGPEVGARRWKTEPPHNRSAHSYESLQVHLTQTPVWNAFWVTCCLLALLSVILSGGGDRAHRADLWATSRRPLPRPFFTRLCFVVFGCVHRPRLSKWNRDTSAIGSTLPTVQPGFPEVRRPLRPLGSSLGSLGGADGVSSSVCHSGRAAKEEKRHLKALIDSLVCQY